MSVSMDTEPDAPDNAPLIQESVTSSVAKAVTKASTTVSVRVRLLKTCCMLMMYTVLVNEHTIYGILM